MSYRPDYLIITVENLAAEEVNLEKQRVQVGSKSARDHGFGLNNIEHMVKKHDGFMKIEQENNTFTVNIALLVDEV